MNAFAVSFSLDPSMVPLAAVKPEDVTAGWLGLVVVLGMAVALFFVLRSFVKQLKKVDFEEEPRSTDKKSDHNEP